MAEQNTGGNINESDSQSSRNESGDGALAPTEAGTEQAVSSCGEHWDQICVVK